MANYNRIQNGMTRAEVYSMLGLPGDYRNGETRITSDAPDDKTTISDRGSGVGWQSVVWMNDEGLVLLWFDKDNHVRSRYSEL